MKKIKKYILYSLNEAFCDEDLLNPGDLPLLSVFIILVTPVVLFVLCVAAFFSLTWIISKL